MSPPSHPTETIDRRSAQPALTEDATLELALVAHGIPTPQIRKLACLAATQPGDDRATVLAHALAQLYLFNPLGIGAGRFFFVGAPGVGKTLAIAKLAARAESQGCAVRLITCDGARRASIDQLRHFATTLGIESEIAADTAARDALETCTGVMTLIDGAGINPYSSSERTALEAVAMAARAEPVLVLAAGGDPADTVETRPRTSSAISAASVSSSRGSTSCNVSAASWRCRKRSALRSPKGFERHGARPRR